MSIQQKVHKDVLLYKRFTFGILSLVIFMLLGIQNMEKFVGSKYDPYSIIGCAFVAVFFSFVILYSPIGKKMERYWKQNAFKFHGESESNKQ